MLTWQVILDLFRHWLRSCHQNTCSVQQHLKPKLAILRHRFKRGLLKEKMSACAKCLVFIIALCSLVACTTNIDLKAYPVAFPEATSVESLDQAHRVLDQATLAREQINWRHTYQEQLCARLFLMHACLSNAQQTMQADLARVKKSEVAARLFLRREKVEAMDRDLAAKNAQHVLPGEYDQLPRFLPTK